jgi:eukaryotic-like serine/threonine-protein kinase
VLESLGGGRRYEVFLVWDEGLQLSAVAKVLRPNRVEDETAVNALRREAALLERLVHPVLARGLGAVLDGPFPHVLVEYVDGDNLREIIEEEATLSLQEALPVGLDLLAALNYMATVGVCHLDVKPSNILLADPARLIDLGAARTFEELATRETPIGTASYMAPEQCEPSSELGPIGPPADVWGVGTTLYHVLTGNRPFSRPGPRGSDPRVRYPQLVERPLPVPDYVPGAVETVIMEMLAHDPRERPTAKEASAALEPLAAEFA